MPPRPDTSVPSSPDPLGNSSLADTPFSSPTKPPARRTSLNKTTTPRKKAANNIKLQDFILKTPPAGLIPAGQIKRSQSPTKSTAKTENLLSPWRIRVTVEAERDEDKQGAAGRAGESLGRSVMKRGTGRTTTTLVPLKGLEDSSPPPAGRRSARSRKSDIGSSPTKGGGVAALVKKRGRRTTLGEDDVGRDLSVGATPGKRGRGRPRKRLPVVDGEDLIMTEAGMATPATISLTKKARGKRKAVSPVSIALDEDLDGDIFGRRGKRLVRNGSVALGETSPNRSLSASPGKAVSAASSRKNAVPKAAQPSDPLNDSIRQDIGTVETGERRSAAPDRTGDAILHIAVRDDHSNDDDQAIPADPTHDHREFDSILESEGFSMVSLESIQSARQKLSSMSNQTIRSTAESAKSNFLTNPALNPPALADEVSKVDLPPAADDPEKGRIANFRQEADESDGGSLIPDIELQHPKSDGLSKIKSSPYQPNTGSGKSVSFSTHNNVTGPDASESSAREAFIPTRSSTEKQPVQKRTPVQIESSPRLPPPGQQAAPSSPSDPTSKTKRDTPKLSRVVRTGVALQGVLDNNGRATNTRRTSLKSPYVSPANKSSSSNVAGKSPQEGLDDQFEGFGAGTRRELRAGLRLGEELARRQRLAAQAQQVGDASGTVGSGDDVFMEANGTGYPKLPTPEGRDELAFAVPATTSEPVVEYPTIQPEQLLSPERSEREEDEMDWQIDTPNKTLHLDLSDPISGQDTFNETIASNFTETREAEWQREREAISRQIEMANSSQVIVISSDDSEALDEPGAIQDNSPLAGGVGTGQAEANSVDHTQSSPSMDGALFPEEMAKPRRGKIPSPWRRDSQMFYSDEATEDPSGLFWQPDQRAMQLAKEREERKRRKESHLDVSGMLKPTQKGIEETRPISDNSMDAKVQQVLQKEFEIIVTEEQIVQVDMTVKNSQRSEEGMPTAQDVQSSEVNPDADESYHMEENVVLARGDTHLVVEANTEDDHDSDDVVVTMEGEPSSEIESDAETTYYSEAEADEVAQVTGDDETPTAESESADEDCEGVPEMHKMPTITNAPAKPAAPQPSQPSSWLSKISSIASSLLWNTTAPKDSWSNAEYLMLDELYQRAKKDARTCPYNPNGGLWGFRLALGRTLLYGNYQLKITKSHLGIADAFRERVRLASLNNGGDGTVEWGEYYVVKRLFSLMVGEDMRARGIPFPDRDVQPGSQR